MAQIVYTAPLTGFARVSIISLFCLATVISWIVLGFESPVTTTLWLIFLTLQLLNVLVDPDVCFIWFTRTNPDGTKVKVKRPLIGFKRCETQIGFTGGYEVRYDGWRYEPALLRI